MINVYVVGLRGGGGGTLEYWKIGKYAAYIVVINLSTQDSNGINLSPMAIYVVISTNV